MNFYKDILIPASEACMKIELAGFIYDVRAAANIMEDEVAPELEAKTHRMRVLTNFAYNPRSTKQTSALFYDDWKLTHEMRARPGKDKSTDESALAEIVAGRFSTKKGSSLGSGITAGDDNYQLVINFAKELDRFRKLVKQADTYIIALIERALRDPEHRLYTDILLHGTTSGRTSSRNPNLQNITRTKEGLPNIRRLFLSSPGRLIVQADYSQAELRCIAQFSSDLELTRIYREGLDLHSIAAERFYGNSHSEEQRVYAKIMNFGVVYGQSATTFQEKNNIPEKQAQKFIDWWWHYFGGVKKWKEQVVKQMRSGRLLSPYGRIRRFYLLTPQNVNAAIREAVNFLPQSTAGDLTLRSVILLSKEMDWKRASIVITVHDSIVGDIDENYVDEWRTICKQIMESRAKDDLDWSDIPQKVDIGVGATWADAK